MNWTIYRMTRLDLIKLAFGEFVFLDVNPEGVGRHNGILESTISRHQFKIKFKVRMFGLSIS